MRNVRRRWVVLVIALLALLLPAFLITGARLDDPTSARGIQLVAFTTLALPLYVLALAITLAVAVRRRAMLLVAVVPLLGAVLHAWWLAPSYLGGNPPPAASAPTRVVMTANLEFGRADPYQVVQLVNHEHVSILALEEITPSTLARMDRAGLDQLLPYRAGVARDGAFGTMLLSSAPVTDAARLPTSFGCWVGTTDGLRVFALHPAPPTDQAGWNHDHAAIDQQAVAQRPDLLLGDFNATLDHEPIRTLVGDGFRSVSELADQGWQPTWPSNGLFRFHGLRLPALVQIDHVFVGPRLAGLGTTSVALTGTDHRALIARVAAK